MKHIVKKKFTHLVEKEMKQDRIKKKEKTFGCFLNENSIYKCMYIYMI